MEDTDGVCVKDVVLVSRGLFVALDDALTLTVAIDGVFVAVVRGDSELERVVETDQDPGLHRGADRRKDGPARLRHCANPLRELPDSG